MTEEYKLITPEMMSLRTYPCGVSAGDIISLKEDMHYQDHKGRPTGAVRPAGSEAMVLTGNPEEPDVIWYRWRDGERETWDSTILETFEITGKAT